MSPQALERPSLARSFLEALCMVLLVCGTVSLAAFADTVPGGFPSTNQSAAFNAGVPKAAPTPAPNTGGAYPFNANVPSTNTSTTNQPNSNGNLPGTPKNSATAPQPSPGQPVQRF